MIKFESIRNFTTVKCTYHSEIDERTFAILNSLIFQFLSVKEERINWEREDYDERKSLPDEEPCARVSSWALYHLGSG